MMLHVVRRNDESLEDEGFSSVGLSQREPSHNFNNVNGGSSVMTMGGGGTADDDPMLLTRTEAGLSSFHLYGNANACST